MVLRNINMISHMFKNGYIIKIRTYILYFIDIKTKIYLRWSWEIESERTNNRENIKSMHMDITINVL